MPQNWASEAGESARRILVVLHLVLAERSVVVVAPRKNVGLRQQTPIEARPEPAVQLHRRLVGQPEGTAGGLTPVNWVKPEALLVEPPAGSRQGEERPGVEVLDNEENDVL